mmetsp:Transcript_15330/g.22953  ORF Transcript_15330/g.22953 Transcript_15330/m.22953 type:complete len:221 (-) Transcript_15330:59-721(-)
MSTTSTNSNASKLVDKRIGVEKEITTLCIEKEELPLARLIEVCESYELDACEEELRPDTVPFYGIQLLAYLVQNDLNAARFLWKRIDAQVKGEQLKAIWKIGQNIWLRNYPQVYSSLDEYDWDDQHKPLIDVLRKVFRARTKHLLEKAYSSISMEDACAFLGLSQQETVNLLVQQDCWIQQGDYLVAPENKTPTQPNNNTVLDQRKLDTLTEYVIFLNQI